MRFLRDKMRLKILVHSMIFLYYYEGGKNKEKQHESKGKDDRKPSVQGLA